MCVLFNFNVSKSDYLKEKSSCALLRGKTRESPCCKMRPDFCTANVSVIVNCLCYTHSSFSKGVQTNKQNCIKIRLIEKKTVIVLYQEVRRESRHVAEMQRNQTNKQTIRLYDGKTTAVHYRNVRGESRQVAEMTPDFCTANHPFKLPLRIDLKGTLLIF